MIDFVFIGVMALLGWLAALPKASRFAFLKALVLLLGLIVGSVVMILIMLLLNGFVYAYYGSGTVESLFTLLAIVLVLAGVGTYWLLVWLTNRTTLENRVLTLVEYLIQWTLIYVTIYQVTIDSVFKAPEVSEILGTNIEALDPTYIMILVLPALISTWIAVILYKLRVKDL